MHVKVKDLPDSVQAALKGASYGRVDIEVIATETLDMSVSGGSGSRGFVTVVNLATGQSESRNGSWGGANMFNPHNAVDLDNTEYVLPPNAVVVKGTQGYPRTWARLYVAPNVVAGNLLPAASSELSETERVALRCYVDYKGGQYRRDEMRRLHVTESDIAGLASRGFIKINKAGAGQVTTEGRNALGPRW